MADPTVTRHADRVLRVAHGTAPEGPVALSKPIGDSWRRCVRDYSLDPVRVYSPAVLSTGELHDRQVQHEQLIQIASAEMDSLYEQISGSGYALLLTDASGIILCEKIDPTLKSLFRSAGLLVGADWSELHEGTNGIGTCISVDGPVTVHRSEHFRARHIGLSCSGAPIHDPAGSLLAVLDASTVDARDTRSSQAHTMALVNLSAQLIEKCIFLQHHQAATLVRFHARPELVNLLHDGSLALGSDGSIVAADAMAARLLGTRAREELVGKKFDEIFDTRIEDLLAPALLARQALWPLRDRHLGRRYFASLQQAAPLSHAPARHTPALTRIEHPAPAQPRTPATSARSTSGNRASSRSNLELTFEQLAGSDPRLQAVARKAARVAHSTLPVLIQGPTGSGKECFARALHTASARQTHAFVAVNCAALPETLIESELFGYGPGAFTGARKEGRKGKIVQSSGGTLFLDEIGDMPLHLQTRLLRVLEEQEVIPLGADTAIPLDLRVVCASNRDLQRMLVTGEFRDDLYYRLNGILLELPPLQARTDKEILIRRLLEEEGQRENKGDGAIDTEAFECLTGYTWPGNIRELRNVIRSAFAICDGNRIRIADLPAALLPDAPIPLSVEPAVTPPGTTLEGAERDTLLSAIRTNRGNLCHTARELGISRNSLYRKLKRHGIGVSRVDGLSVRLSEPPASPPKP
jgi:transcriptional regulator of acetoin/glycerol metabolism